MNRDDTFDFLRAVTGFWPFPEMSEDEARAWNRQLATADEVIAIETLDALVAAGTHWRPTPSEFTLTYRLRAARAPRSAVDRSVPELVVSTEHHTAGEWLAICRRQLDEATGPLADSLRPSFRSNATHRLEVDPNNPFPEEVHQRAMARARQLAVE